MAVVANADNRDSGKTASGHVNPNSANVAGAVHLLPKNEYEAYDAFNNCPEREIFRDLMLR